MNEINDSIIKSIEILLEEKLKSHNKTQVFQSVIYKANDDNTYQIIKEKQPYNVKNGLGTELKVGQGVWVMIPNGELRNMFIFGVR